MLRFKPVSYIDKACTALEAFSLLMPAGWGFDGGVRWIVNNTMMPATLGFRISGDGIELQALPGKAFFWTSLTPVGLSHPAGSSYLGATVCPPLSAPEFLAQVMLPALRPDVEDLSVVRESPPVAMGSTLGFETTFKSCGSPSSYGAMMKVTYRQGGRHYEEELYCTITSFEFSIPAGASMIDYVFWMADHLFSFRAENGRLNGMKDLLQAVMYSFRLNPQWFEKSNRIVAFLKDRQLYRPYSLRQLSVEVDQAETSQDDSLDAYRQRQSAYRWISDSLCRADSAGEYYDPIQQICVRLPGGYDFAWASDTGEYLLSNSSDNAHDYGISQVWEQMEPISTGSPAVELSPSPETCA